MLNSWTMNKPGGRWSFSELSNVFFTLFAKLALTCCSNNPAFVPVLTGYQPDLQHKLALVHKLTHLWRSEATFLVVEVLFLLAWRNSYYFSLYISLLLPGETKEIWRITPLLYCIDPAGALLLRRDRCGGLDWCKTWSLRGQLRWVLGGRWHPQSNALQQPQQGNLIGWFREPSWPLHPSANEKGSFLLFKCFATN